MNVTEKSAEVVYKTTIGISYFWVETRDIKMSVCHLSNWYKLSSLSLSGILTMQCLQL